MSLTLSVIRAALGASAGHEGAHLALLESARNHLALAVQQGTLTDAHAYGVGEGIALLLVHEHGESAEAVHRLAWDTLAAAAEVARGLHLSGAGRDLLTDEFPGSLRAAGPAFAELTLDERPAETVVVLLSTQTATGAYNLPLYRAFADPFNTPGLVLAEALHEGFTFEVHDTMLGRKIVFTTPQETYDLLGFIGAPSRFVVKRIASRATGEVACVASTERIADLGGGSTDDGPVAIVRTHGVFPTTGELTEPFATPSLVAGGMRGTHVAPWMPVALDAATPGRWDGP
ncbi:MAG: fructose 1,6-bisphosphatase, partial [Chloroflexi bacterium]|nr:fructose 1,6-bisphosphatase [Chloroflexota bacterium]